MCLHVEPKTAVLVETLQRWRRGDRPHREPGDHGRRRGGRAGRRRRRGVRAARRYRRRPQRARRARARPGAGPAPRQRRRSDRRRGGTRRRARDGGDRGDDLRRQPAAGGARGTRPVPGRGDQRQPAQAADREPVRRRADRGRGLHARHEPPRRRDDVRGRRLRVVRARDREGVACARRDGARRRGELRPCPRGCLRRHARVESRACARAGRCGHHRGRNDRDPRRRGAAEAPGRSARRQRGALLGDRRAGPGDPLDGQPPRRRAGGRVRARGRPPGPPARPRRDAQPHRRRRATRSR